MVLLKNGARILFKKHGLYSFQGHYVNRLNDEIRCQCQGTEQQKRNLFNFPKKERVREYRGRQLVGHTMDQMFEVVSDVDNYHKFLPWCKKSIVKQRNTQNLKADLVIGFPPINESYTSNVTLLKPHLVKAECKDGKLFHHMLTLWRFSPGLKRELQSCVIDFQISFEFRSAFHSHLSNIFFDQVARQMESAFIKEVGRRYGPASIQPINLLLNTTSHRT
ncbi:coenzyme Q-binding protein COQ10, mitochondrial [Spodoptera litura]|uniref:Coenzyme Q-binding protein COQ10, mitochondrial n=1 Tax=Spodoptera litura TaxID=69820 RepID=A0A9J7IM32_SPOLT|nr:coenzyme Q-binding protein COQ10, mitochondrial [Spodoptera litura]